MNQDGDLLNIDHGAQEEPENTAEATFSSPTDAEPVDIFADASDEADETPNIQPNISSAEADPTPTESVTRRSSGTIISRSRYRARQSNQFDTANTFSSAAPQQTPQFFNNAMIADAPAAKQPLNPNIKKLLGIGAGIVVVIGAVVVLLMTLTGEGGILSDRNLAAARTNFKLYANKLLFNTDSDANLPAFSAEQDYTLSEQYASDEGIDSAYVDTLVELYAKYTEALEKVDSNKLNENVTNFSSNNELALNFIQIYAKQATLDSDAVLATYAKKGKSAAQKEIQDYLALFSDENNVFNKDFVTAKKAELEDTITFATSIAKYGCLNGSVNEACIKNAIYQDKTGKLNNLFAKTLDDYEESDYAVLSTIGELEENCWSIYKPLSQEETK